MLNRSTNVELASNIQITETRIAYTIKISKINEIN